VAHHGLTLVDARVLSAPSSIEDGRQGMRDLAPKLGQRTALFGSSDLVAFGAIVEATRLGIAIPERLAVCGFGDFEISRSSLPAFTTVRVDGAEIGRVAAEKLLARIKGNTGAERVLVPFEIIARDTT
jgi:LacI family gluconate utilization system Gnt-I transcriptional repressor